jgi:hypothetical protein
MRVVHVPYLVTRRVPPYHAGLIDKYQVAYLLSWFRASLLSRNTSFLVCTLTRYIDFLARTAYLILELPYKSSRLDCRYFPDPSRAIFIIISISPQIQIPRERSDRWRESD